MEATRHRLVRKALIDPPGQGESVEGGSASWRKLSRAADTPNSMPRNRWQLDRAEAPGKR